MSGWLLIGSAQPRVRMSSQSVFVSPVPPGLCISIIPPHGNGMSCPLLNSSADGIDAPSIVNRSSLESAAMACVIVPLTGT